MQKTYNALSALTIVALAFMQGCGGFSGDVNPKFTKIITDTVTVVETETVTKFDTLWQTKYVKLPGDIDTIFVPTEVVAENTHTPRPAINRYEGEQKDDEVSVLYDIMTEGELLSLELDYKILKPRFIKQTDTVTVTKTHTIDNVRYKSGFYFGGGASYQPETTLLSANVGAMITLPSRWAFDYKYDFIQKEHSIGAKFRIIPIGK